MKKKGKNLFWTGSIALAFISAITVYVILLQIEKNELSDFEKETVYMAKTQISKGQKIDEQNWDRFFEAVDMDVRWIPEQAIKAGEEVQEMLSGQNIDRGVVMTKSMFIRMDSLIDDMTEPVIAGLKADDIYQVSGGILRTGDKIHIFSVNEDGSVTLKWSNVFVQQAFDGAGNMIPAEDTDTVAQRINIFMEKEDVEELYSHLGTGSLRVVKVCE